MILKYLLLLLEWIEILTLRQSWVRECRRWGWNGGKSGDLRIEILRKGYWLRLRLIQRVIREDIISFWWLERLRFGRVQILFFYYWLMLLLDWYLRLTLGFLLLHNVYRSSTLISCINFLKLEHIFNRIILILFHLNQPGSSNNWLTNSANIEHIWWHLISTCYCLIIWILSLPILVWLFFLVFGEYIIYFNIRCFALAREVLDEFLGIVCSFNLTFQMINN